MAPAGGMDGSSGEVSEWLKEHAWKVGKRLNRASGVRIPLSPPSFALQVSMVAPSAPRDARSKTPPGPEGSNGIDRRGRRGQLAGPSPFLEEHGRGGWVEAGLRGACGLGRNACAGGPVVAARREQGGGADRPVAQGRGAVDETAQMVRARPGEVAGIPEALPRRTQGQRRAGRTAQEIGRASCRERG